MLFFFVVVFKRRLPYHVKKEVGVLEVGVSEEGVSCKIVLL